MKLKKFHKIIANTPEEIKEDVNLSMDILEQPTQTAVEWLFLMLNNPNIDQGFANKLLEEAKEMEKQQIIDAFWNGDNSDCTLEQNSKEFAEQYYNKKYNQNK